MWNHLGTNRQTLPSHPVDSSHPTPSPLPPLARSLVCPSAVGRGGLRAEAAQQRPREAQACPQPPAHVPFVHATRNRGWGCTGAITITKTDPGSNLAPPIIPHYVGQVVTVRMFVPLFGKCGKEHDLSLKIIMSMMK